MECTIKIKGVETTFASMEAFDSYIHEKYNTLYEYVHNDENFQLAKIFEINLQDEVESKLNDFKKESKRMKRFHIKETRLSPSGVSNFMFDPDDPKSKCKLCGALCKDIFKIENNSVMLKPSISKW